MLPYTYVIFEKMFTILKDYLNEKFIIYFPFTVFMVLKLTLCKVIIYILKHNTFSLMSCLSVLFAQVVNMEFEGGLTAAFSMVAFSEEMCKRKTTIYGSKVGLEGMLIVEKKWERNITL